MTDNENKILILTGGEVEDDLVSRLVEKEKYSMYIAADRGLMVADRLNIGLDYIVGDFDSVPVEILQKYQEQSIPIQTYPTEKDKTDTQIAIELGLTYGATYMDILGATGSRLDHTLANIHLLMLPLQAKIQACIINRNNKIYLKNESFELTKDRQYGDYVSLLPFTEKVSGLTLTGFKYPLHNVTLTAGSSIGISNEIDENIASVAFLEGIMLVIESRD